MSMRILALIMVILAAPAFSAGTEALDRAVNRFYNFDFRGSHAILDSYISEHAADPLGHVFRGAALLFSELDRLRILEGEFFTNDEKLISTKKLGPDVQVQRQFEASVEQGRRLAEARLAVDRNDRDGLFALCVAYGLMADYRALVERRQWNSVTYAKQSQTYAVRLLRIDPTAYDAHLTTGVHEYILACMPFFLRWFVHLDQVQGSNQAGVQHLTLVVNSGRYFKPFGKILLAIVNLREKNLPETRRLLQELSTEFPDNPLFRKELDKVSELMKRGAAAR